MGPGVAVPDRRADHGAASPPGSSVGDAAWPERGPVHGGRVWTHGPMATTYTEADFERLSWHDCTIWGLELHPPIPSRGTGRVILSSISTSSSTGSAASGRPAGPVSRGPGDVDVPWGVRLAHRDRVGKQWGLAARDLHRPHRARAPPEIDSGSRAATPSLADPAELAPVRGDCLRGRRVHPGTACRPGRRRPAITVASSAEPPEPFAGAARLAGRGANARGRPLPAPLKGA